MKYMKVYGAKGQNTLTFLEGKHTKHITEVKEKYENRTTRYKSRVTKAFQN